MLLFYLKHQNYFFEKLAFYHSTSRKTTVPGNAYGVLRQIQKIALRKSHYALPFLLF